MRFVIHKSLRFSAIRAQLFLAALLLGGSGAVLVALSTSDAPPALRDLPREVGRLGGVLLHQWKKGAPYLELTIGGLQYTVDSYDRAWLDSVRSAVHIGDTLTVWGRAVPIGSSQIWQLAHGDSLVVSYAERSQRKIAQNRKTIVFGEVLLAIGLALLAAGQAVGTRQPAP